MQFVPGSFSWYRAKILLTQPYPLSSPPSFNEGTGVVLFLCALCAPPLRLCVKPSVVILFTPPPPQPGVQPKTPMPQILQILLQILHSV